MEWKHGDELTIADLVANGTMSAEMAAVLWAAVDQGVSFLTVAVPQNAGKSTTANGVLALRPPGVALHPVGPDLEEYDRLERERLGGYLVVAEFSPRMRRNYIWDEPARRAFDVLTVGYSLQGSLHAPSAVDGFREITKGIGVRDDRAAALKLLLYIEMFGDSQDPDVRRRLVDLYEVRGVDQGEPLGRSLFRWRSGDDGFEQFSEPATFSTAPADLSRRAALMAELARTGRTSPGEVAEAVGGYRRALASLR